MNCCEAATGDPAATLEQRAAYQRSYMRRRRSLDGSRTQWLTVLVPGRGKMLARWSVSREEVRITGRFALREEALRVITGAFGASASEVRERGQGGGKGARRQKTFSTVGPVDAEAWAAGVALLVTAGAAREGKR
jgi:hypothetical protein